MNDLDNLYLQYRQAELINRGERYRLAQQINASNQPAPLYVTLLAGLIQRVQDITAEVQQVLTNRPQPTRSQPICVECA